ncbi:hypothetical protein [Streptomyces sp. NPDC090798]|uniref:hypothetical protein n=1 Tax=Streptomyces sp. NPDC090798 TaxID=3365968 RepID=UPI0037F3486E
MGAAGWLPHFPESGVGRRTTRCARFDGRGRVELLPGHATAPKQRRIEQISHVLGYRLLVIQNLGRVGVRLVCERDDARTRAAA